MIIIITRIRYCKAYFYLAILFTIWIIIYENLYFIKIKRDSSHLEKLLAESKHECSPILKESSQFYANFNSEKYPKIIPTYFNASINFSCLNSYKNLRPKIILLWNSLFYQDDFGYGIGGEELFKRKKCPVYHCEITRNKSLLNESDLVIVHMRGSLYNLPKKRLTKSRLVFFIAESPSYSKKLTYLNGVFNLTAHYKQDSHFSPFYYSGSLIQWKLNTKFDENKNFYSSKTKLATAMISNCNDNHSKRLAYIKNMQKYMSVDIFGKCGKKCVNCSRAELAKDYLFYLSFENSLCIDYITEKFYETLVYDMVPVVLGGGPYDKLIPNSAYIDIRDYKTVRELTNYLLYLSKNATAYNSYFKWKKYVNFLKEGLNSFCDMFIKLHLESFYGVRQSVLSNIDEFYSYKSNCMKSNLSNGEFTVLLENMQYN